MLKWSSIFQIQCWREFRRDLGRIWLEACSRRCIPTSTLSQALHSTGGIWCSDLLHGPHHNRAGHVGYAFPSLSWCPYDCRDFALRIHGSHCWVHGWSPIQDIAWPAMEVCCLLDSYTFPCFCLLHLLLPQLLHLGKTFEWGCTIHNHDGPVLPVDLCVGAFDFHWLLLWIPQAALWTSCAD